MTQILVMISCLLIFGFSHFTLSNQSARPDISRGDDCYGLRNKAMRFISPKLFLFVTLSMIIVLSSACDAGIQQTSAGMSTSTIPESNDINTPAASVASPSLLPTLTMSPAATSTITPTKLIATPITFPTNIYLTALPLKGGAWNGTSGCPNSLGLQIDNDLESSTSAFMAKELFYSGDLKREKAVTDVALWPILPFPDLTPQNGNKDEFVPQDDWIEKIALVKDSDFYEFISGQCGREIANSSWVFTFCSGPCAQNPSESLKTQLFVVNREGRWLIWATK